MWVGGGRVGAAGVSVARFVGRARAAGCTIVARGPVGVVGVRRRALHAARATTAIITVIGLLPI